MDEENKSEQEYIKKDDSRPHVSIFGMDMDKGSGSNAPGNSGSTNQSSEAGDPAPGSSGSTNGTNPTKEDWRRQKEEWRARHRARREAWKAERHNNWGGPGGHHRDGGFFFGLIILFAGVIALLYTMGYISSAFWHVILPFWPILLILWGMSIILGRHWSARIILFIITLAFLLAVVIYGLVRVNSPLVNNLPPNVTNSINNMQPAQY